MTQNKPIYHYTTTSQLPWILGDDVIRPGTCSKERFEGLDPLDFVWATSSPIGAASAAAFFLDSAQAKLLYGAVWAVRFQLSAADFEPWPAAIQRLPGWTNVVVRRFNDTTAEGDDPNDWYTHNGPVDRAKWLSIEARDYLGEWRQVKLDTEVTAGDVGGKPCRSVVCGGYMFGSLRTSDEPRTYQPSVADLISMTVIM